MNKYAETLDEMIHKSGINLTELSKRCEEIGMKVTVSYLSKLRNGKMPPPSMKISAVIARALDADPEKLIAASVYDDKERNKKEIREALEFIYPDGDKSEIFEKMWSLSVTPDNILYKEEREEEYLIQEKALEELYGSQTAPTLILPVIGSIPAGKPVKAVENIEEWIEVPNMWKLKQDEAFVLRVKGDSMIGSRIYEGDKVVVKMQPEVENGDIAVVNVDGENATLKRVKKINGQVILFPDNPNYEPILIDNDQARVVGKVIQVMFEP